MSKQWTCKDCVKQNTDACYFTEVLDGHKYCHDIVVDVDYAYEQGRADVWTDIEKIINNMTNPIDTMRIIIEQLKEQKQCSRHLCR